MPAAFVIFAPPPPPPLALSTSDASAPRHHPFAQPYPAIFLNCVLWATYGGFKNDYFLFFSNAAGILLGTWFTASALQLADADGRRLLERAFVAAVALLLLTGLVAGYALRPAGPTDCRAEHFVGGACATAAILFYAMPLSSAVEVVKSRSAASLSLPLCLASLANATAWGLYGVALGDGNIMLPNAPGIGCALLQLYLIQRYKAPASAKDEEGEGLLLGTIEPRVGVERHAGMEGAPDAVSLTVATHRVDHLPGRSLSPKEEARRLSLSLPGREGPAEELRRASVSRERSRERGAPSRPPSAAGRD